uniref:Ribosomal protein S13 n=1 Tax=Tsukubamonas globosa TaxID=875863 RepID=W8VRA7_9EUKA|nr:ribosomal protein S13 [Tsukubamonas globosa]BAO51959.1 ribosomal protein S13 [Tsukubamonas globosa]
MRFLGHEIKEKYPIQVALTTVFGIGTATANLVCFQLGISPLLRIGLLSELQLNKLRRWVELNTVIDFELKKKLDANMDLILNTNSYKALRHRSGLPVRGQRTRSNAKNSTSTSIRT